MCREKSDLILNTNKFLPKANVYNVRQTKIERVHFGHFPSFKQWTNVTNFLKDFGQRANDWCCVKWIFLVCFPVS